VIFDFVKPNQDKNPSSILVMMSVFADLYPGDYVQAEPYHNLIGGMIAILDIKTVNIGDNDINVATFSICSITRRYNATDNPDLSNMDVRITEFSDRSYMFQQKRLKAKVDIVGNRAIITTKIMPQSGYQSFIRDITYFCQALGLTSGRDHEIISLN